MFGELLGDLPIVGDILGQLSGQKFQREQQEDAQRFNTAEAAAQRDWSAEEARKQRHWTEMMSATSYGRAVGDLKAAGLNPMLSIMHGGNQATGGAMPSGAAATSPTTGHQNSLNFGASMQSASAIKVNEEIADRTAAETDKIEAEAAEIRERTPTHAVTRAHLRQQIFESTAQVEKILQETSTSYHSAQNIQQQTRNLQETIPQIRATVQNLKALTKLHGAMEGKTLEETKEIQQKVAANLPGIEAILKNLERQQRTLAMPHHEAQSSAASSYVGQLGAYLREINPLKGWLQ